MLNQRYFFIFSVLVFTLDCFASVKPAKSLLTQALNAKTLNLRKKEDLKALLENHEQESDKQKTITKSSGLTKTTSIKNFANSFPPIPPTVEHRSLKRLVMLQRSKSHSVLNLSDSSNHDSKTEMEDILQSKQPSFITFTLAFSARQTNDAINQWNTNMHLLNLHKMDSVKFCQKSLLNLAKFLNKVPTNHSIGVTLIDKDDKALSKLESSALHQYTPIKCSIILKKLSPEATKHLIQEQAAISAQQRVHLEASQAAEQQTIQFLSDKREDDPHYEKIWNETYPKFYEEQLLSESEKNFQTYYSEAERTLPEVFQGRALSSWKEIAQNMVELPEIHSSNSDPKLESFQRLNTALTLVHIAKTNETNFKTLGFNLVSSSISK